MATNVFELFAKLGLDDSEYQSKLKSAGKAIGSLGGTIMKVGGIAISAGSAAMTAFGKSAIDAGMSFDSSMSQVAATMGKTVDEIQELRDFAQEMGSITAFSATQAADALNYMALAGYDADTSMKMLPNVLNLAAAGGMDLALASDMITDSQSALGLSLDDTAKLVDKMSQAASKSNTSVSQLGDAILTVGGTAKNLKGGTTELATVLGILADNGVKGSEGGTALRNILNSLTAPTENASKLLNELGVNVYDSAGNMRSLNDVFLDMRDAMDSMTQQERMNVISTVFNARDMKSAEALLANVGDRFDELSGYIDEAAGASSAMAETQLDNLAGDITLFQSALEGAKIAISDDLTPSLREFVQFGSSSLSDLTKAFKEGGISGAMEALGDILANGLNLILSKAPEFIEAGIGLVSALGNGLLENLDVIINSAIEIAGAIGSALISALPRLQEAAETIIMTLGEAILSNGDTVISSIIELAENLISNFVEFLPEFLKLGSQIVAMLATSIAQQAPTLIPAAVQTIITLVNTLLSSDNISLLLNAAMQLIIGLTTGIIDALPILIDALPQIVETIVQIIVDNIPMILDAAVVIIMTLIDGLVGGDSIEKLGKAAGDIIIAILKVFVNSGPQLIEAAIKLVGELAFGLLKGAAYIVIAAFDLIHAFYDSLIDGGKELFKAGEKVAENVKNGISDTIEAAKQWGKDLIENFVEGISDKANALGDKVKDVAGTVADFLGFSEPKKGPLSNFHTYAPDMMDLFMQGIKDNESDLRRQIASTFDIQGDIAQAVYTSPHGTSMGMPIGFGNMHTGNEQPIVIQIDGETFAKFVYKHYNNQAEKVGTTLTEAVSV